MKTTLIALSLVVGAPALARAACPDPVKAAVDKAYPSSKIASCRHETEDGREQFEVKLTRTDGVAMELDVSPAGAILQTEEKVALSSVPDAVRKAFAAAHPKAKASRAEKETHADGGVFYELAFTGADGKRHESTFSADGKHVEDE